ncbi:hypothetical protein ACVXG7_04945 [Enterobacter hormaechei]
MVNDGSQIVSVATVGSTAPVAFKNLVIPMAVSAAIQDTNTLAITDDTNMDGQATFTISICNIQKLAEYKNNARHCRALLFTLRGSS